MSDREIDLILQAHREQRREKASHKLTKDDLIKSIIVAFLSCLMFIEW